MEKKTKAKGMMNIFKKRSGRLLEENKKLKEKIKEIEIEPPVKKAMGGVLKNRGGMFKGTY